MNQPTDPTPPASLVVAPDTPVATPAPPPVADFRMGLEPTDGASAWKLAQVFARAGFCGVSSPDDALIRMLAGRAFGLTAVESVMSFHVIKGRPVMDASRMVAICLRSPLCEYFRCEETTDERATYAIKRRGQPEQRFTYTAEQAKTAGLLGKDNWRNNRPAMLRARASSGGARMVMPDVVANVYTADEMDSQRHDARDVPVAEESGPRPRAVALEPATPLPPPVALAPAPAALAPAPVAVPAPPSSSPALSTSVRVTPTIYNELVAGLAKARTPPPMRALFDRAQHEVRSGRMSREDYGRFTRAHAARVRVLRGEADPGPPEDDPATGTDWVTDDTDPQAWGANR